MKAAELDLPEGLDWSAERASEHPIFGWLLATYDIKVPTTTLVGQGVARDRQQLCTTLRFNA